MLPARGLRERQGKEMETRSIDSEFLGHRIPYPGVLQGAVP